MDMSDPEMRMVALSEILVGDYEVRTPESDPDLVGLADSISRVGLLCPLGLEQRLDGLHLVHGHRRYSACVLCRLVRVPALIAPEGQSRSREASFAENFHRRDLSPLEQASEIADVLEKGVMTVAEVAAVFHRSVEWVRDQVAMLAWPGDILEVIQARQISVAAASVLAKIEEEAYRRFLVRNGIDNGVTEATARIWLQGWRMMQPATEVVGQEAVAAPGGPRVIPPMSLCMCCRQETRPDGLCVVYICPGCLQVIQRMQSEGS